MVLRNSILWVFRIVVFILITMSCSKNLDYQLDEAERQISIDPYSAYEELANISQEKLRSERCRARYSLLMSLAMDKSYIDVANDSLIQIAVDYYSRRGTDRELMQAMYSLGRVQINAGNATAAIVSLLQAKQLAEKLSDYHYLGLACRNIADLYGSCRDEDTELEYFEESYQAFVRGGDRGTVTDNDGNPLPGIKVKPLMGWWSDDVEKYWGNSEDDPRYYGVFHTDADGKVEVITSLDAWDAENEDIRIAFEDEDGPQNGGSFARDTLFRKDLDIQKVSDGDGHWLEGKYQIDFQKKLSPEDE